jgi:hypothetical protein
VKVALEKDVAGQYNTFRIYVYMMRFKEATARKVANDLKLSSPSLAMLHLEKLVKHKLLRKQYGTYYLEEAKRVGVLRFFYQYGSWFIPRSLFYSVFFLSMSIMFLLLSNNGIEYFIPFSIALLSTLINIYETIQFYKLLPLEVNHRDD